MIDYKRKCPNSAAVTGMDMLSECEHLGTLCDHTWTGGRTHAPTLSSFVMPLEAARHAVGSRTLTRVRMLDRRLARPALEDWLFQHDVEQCLYGANNGALYQLYGRCLCQRGSPLLPVPGAACTHRRSVWHAGARSRPRRSL